IVDTWRHEVGREVCQAGADLLNDAWGGVDPKLAEVAAEFGVGLVCAHTGGVQPRTRPHRVEYDDVMADVIERTVALAERAVAAGVPRDRILIDPAHDFGKNTWQSLEVTRRVGELVDSGWPVLVSLSDKGFVGESLGLPVGGRLMGTLAVTALCAWQGALCFEGGVVGWLGVPVGGRLVGARAGTAVCAGEGALLIRAHRVPETGVGLDR